MWCPKCKNEYVAGITECADCHVPLVEELPKEAETEGLLAEPDEEMGQEQEKEPVTRSRIYVKKETAYEDMKSTAATFLGIGTLGIVFILLWIFDVIHLNMEGYMKVLMCIVMGALFAAFLIIGIRYQLRLRSVREEAGSEEKLTKELISWFMDTFRAEDIDGKITDMGAGSEQLYYERYAVMERCLAAQYPDLEQAYQDHILEELYGRIFEE